MSKITPLRSKIVRLKKQKVCNYADEGMSNSIMQKPRKLGKIMKSRFFANSYFYNSFSSVHPHPLIGIIPQTQSISARSTLSSSVKASFIPG